MIKNAKCQPHHGYNYIFQLEDDRSVMDMPADRSAAKAGFTTDNAYYMGNTELNALDISSAEVCVGKQSNCQMTCYPISTEYWGGDGTDYAHITDLATPLKKMVGCFAGLCPCYSSEMCNAYSGHWFYQCTKDKSQCGIQWYATHAGMKIGGHPANGGPVAWHSWGSGVTLWYDGARELDNWARDGSGVDTMWLRVSEM